MALEPRRDVFQAIADPTRREIISLLAKRRMNVSSLAENFDVSRPAISQHVKILAECGLVTIHQAGRERYCEARLKKLNEVAQWVDKYKAFWNSKLDALEKFLDSTDTTPKRSNHEKKRRKGHP